MTDVIKPSWIEGFVPTDVRANGRWPKGVSGNPAGRPKGSLSSRDKVARQLSDDGPDVARKVIEAALAGDMQAAALVLSRVLPPLRSQTERVSFAFDPELPISKQVEQVLAAVAGGQVPPDIGKQIIDGIAALSNVRATENLEERIIALEARELN